ncbi:lipolytic enzyme [Thermoclostridium stercorarium subsp. stercorarium DSM 8532]|jgi:acyl-CoA thioesterase-1|uniref:Lipolytic enzyme n=3 Tax=Thermoclostridium stercorarium TaxID=1510 RepID=L7VQ23_THES1|nr:SGNH/GDSL hydrolase family protein [Thermoclostridium stercorarium]AGC68531.1 lipolytic enzyme [Thermoclostridium stercorarium subsp. stercorarium DSM 8532]AGI39546.1 lysophospholipase [Thermoclostridium stercorarium subsp. stercorarium DSM 8532]ANW98882.1 G-D-S-L family lipolytic protein [Thermoclostridium stercorarium subsp. thermolacticum DSM 2910]ANX01409.1 G-D-S-L family lipolytic protein [Thermoclostridium stercorarium subsp. leptospartum DSM 9219]UZQ84516.1 SGNH/GDSL hydrolase family
MSIIQEQGPFKIIVSGDSISKGIVYDETKNKYTILEENYVELLRDKLNAMVYNASRFGSTLIKGIQKLKNSIFSEKPDIVLIEYGGNDCDFNWDEIARNPDGTHLPRTDFQTFENVLRDAIDFVRRNKSIPVLMNLPPLNADKYFNWISKSNPVAKENILKWLGSVTKIYWWQERYNSVIQKIADETKTVCIDIREAFLRFPDFTTLLCIDGIHPNRDGHKVIANKIVEFLNGRYNFLLKNHLLPASDANTEQTSCLLLSKPQKI